MDDILDLGPLRPVLEVAMIKYAYIFGRMLYCEYGWREFKQVYECTQTPTELRAKFWNEIMPNLQRYGIVLQTPSIEMKLKQIYNPRDHTCEAKTFDHVTRISRLQYEDERNAELQRKQFEKMEPLKQVARDYIREYTANRDTMPGPSLSTLEPSLGGLHYQRMSRGNDDPTIEVPSVRNQSHSNADGTNRLCQGSTSVSATPEMDPSTMEQSVRQSSGESTVRQGSESSRGRSRSPM